MTLLKSEAQSDGFIDPGECKGKLEFDQVCFHYATRRKLRLKRNETFGIVLNTVSLYTIHMIHKPMSLFLQGTSGLKKQLPLAVLFPRCDEQKSAKTKRSRCASAEKGKLSS